MNKFKVIVHLLLFSMVKVPAQNRVPNYSFEQHADCSTNVLRNATDWCSVSDNCTYFNSCLSNNAFKTPYQYIDNCYQGFQVPRTGSSYTSIYGYIITSTVTPDRYAQVKLLDTLHVTKMYCVTFYVSLWNYSQYSTDKLGAVLTPTPFPCLPPATASNYTMTGVMPQIVSPAGEQLDDTLHWMEVSGVYTANGTEAYLTLGDFFPQAQHSIVQSYPGNCNAVADYYLDDVSVEEVQPAKAKADYTLSLGDSTLIGNNPSEATLYLWQPSAGLSCPTCANPNASPGVTTTYTVTKTQCKAITTDEIKITIGNVGINEVTPTDNFVKLYPNPSNGLVTISSRYEMSRVEISTVTGQRLLTATCHENTQLLQLSDYAAGIYYLKIIYPNSLSVTKKLLLTP